MVRPTKRAAAALGAAVLLGSVVIGRAASLATGARSLGSGAVPLAACDSDGFTVLRAVGDLTVASVTVGGIAATCAGGTMSVSLNNGTATSTAATQTVPGGGGSLAFDFTLAGILAADSERIDVAVSGP